MSDVHCPRCRAAPLLTVGFGVLREDVCAVCRGRLLHEDAAARLIGEENGVSQAMLKELMALFASKERIQCPACQSKMNPVHIRGVRVDVCGGCGCVWLDAGELARLSEGRHEELSPTTPAPAPPQEPAGGEPTFAVLLASLGDLPKTALTAAFAKCPGLTEQDAVALARNNNGVVVDAVSEETAKRVVDALFAEGIDAAVAHDSWTHLPVATHTNSIEAQGGGIVLGRDANRLKVPWSKLAALAAGVVRRSALRQVAAQREGIMTTRREAELAVVEADEPVIDVVLQDPPRRLRVSLATAVFGVQGRGRMELFRERILECARLMGPMTAVGRGVTACVEDRELPHYRSLRDLEREESWLLWKHYGPGANA